MVGTGTGRGKEREKGRENTKESNSLFYEETTPTNMLQEETHSLDDSINTLMRIGSPYPLRPPLPALLN
jgi:hypothetical protein